MEFGRDGVGRVILADEVGTPDASRYWELSAWSEGRYRKKRRAPAPFDKQIVREWGIEQGIDKFDPLSPDDIARAHTFEVPQKLISETTRIFREILYWVTKKNLEMYQRIELGIDLSKSR